MKTQLLAASAVALAMAGAVGGAALARPVAGEAAVSTPAAVDNFRLVDHTGFAHELRRLVDVKAIVLVSHVNGDKASRKSAAALEALKTKHPDFEFLMLNATPGVTRAALAEEAKGLGLTIPILHDDLQLVGDQLGLTHAGEAFVLEPKTLRVLYHGPVDAAGAAKKAKGYLAEALADIESQRPIAVASVAGKGAAIPFPDRARRAQHAQISYATDVAPILEAKCVTCHQDGGIGPFAMSSYEIVKGFAPMIRESIRTASMPPWHADPLVGNFKHPQGLSDAQTRTLVHWIEAGAPRGESADPLAAVQHVAPEWPLGEPDLVVNVPAYTIPASGVVDYQYPTAPNPLTEGRWVKAATLMPGDRRGVHHILGGYISGDPRPGPASAGQWEANYGEYAVGGESFQVPDGLGIYLPPGGHMGFQMHYTPYGREAVDNSKVGFYFYPEGETPDRILHHTVIADNLIELPPNTDRHREVAYLKFPKDAYLYSIFLHTHYRGQAGHVDLVLEDGTKTPVINLPRYDFNWQRTYDLVEPLLIPKNAKLVATYYYDNSVRNPANPDPTETVRWGDQSWEEMHYTSIYYQWADETVAKPADATDQMRAGRLMGMLDDDLDERISRAELKGRIGAMLLPRFADLDSNGDGMLDAAEINAATRLLGGFLNRS